MSEKLQGPKVLTSEDAWEIQNRFVGIAHGWIQWKGTEVCMDVHCKCGALGHVDAEYAYHVKCDYCGRIYMMNGHIELIELEQEPASQVALAQKDED